MALITCNFFSETLGKCTAMNVILPEPKNGSRPGKIPLLYLFHGYSDDHTIWLRRTSVERYASEMNLAIVMPDAYLSYYTDMVCGRKYWTFISEELPRIVSAYFNISQNRNNTFVAGLSMGGYGAFKLALSHPERFRAAASFSGVMDVYSYYKSDLKERGNDFKDVFGSHKNIPGSKNDLFHLAGSLREKNIRPPMLYQYCGTEDFLYEYNVSFRDYLYEIEFPLEYEEWPGEHEWGFWDVCIRKFLENISNYI